MENLNSVPAQTSPTPAPAPSAPPSPEGDLKRKKMLVGLFLVIFAGAVAYFFSSSDMFRGAFLAGQEKEVFQQAMTDLSKTDGADYEATYKNKIVVGDQTRNVEIAATGKLNFAGTEGAQHTIKFTGTGSTKDPTSSENTLLLSAKLGESFPEDGEQLVDITWGDLEMEAEFDHTYKLYKSTKESDLSDAGNLAGSNTYFNNSFGATVPKKYTDLLTSSGTYFYRMLKVSKTEQTQVLKTSKTVSVTHSTTPKPAESVVIKYLYTDDKGINLTWFDPNPSTGKRYEVYRIRTVGANPLIDGAPISSVTITAETQSQQGATYADTNAKIGEEYYYFVRKIGANDIVLIQSPDSAHVTWSGEADIDIENIDGFGLKVAFQSPNTTTFYPVSITLEPTFEVDSYKLFKNTFVDGVKIGKTELEKTIPASADGKTLINMGEGIDPGTYQWIIVGMKNGKGVAKFEDEVRTLPHVPDAGPSPEFFTATGNVEGAKITLNWKDDATTIPAKDWAYYIHEGPTESAALKKTFVGQNLGTSWNASPGTYFFFIVKKTLDDNVMVAQSQLIKLEVLAPEPMILSGTMNPGVGITLTFSDPAQSENDQYIMYKTLSPGAVKNTTSLVAAEEYILQQLAPGTWDYNNANFPEEHQFKNGVTYYFVVGKYITGAAEFISVSNEFSITYEDAPPVAFLPTSKSFASMLMADVLPPAGEKSPYEETISGGGTLTETKGGLQGTLTLADRYEVLGTEYTQSIIMQIKNGKIESVVGNLGSLENNNEPALQFITQDFLEKGYEQYFKINAFLEAYQKDLNALRDGIQNAATNTALADATSKNDGGYESTVDAFTTKMASYPENAADKKIIFLTDKNKITAIEATLKFGEGKTSLFFINNLHAGTGAPAGNPPVNPPAGGGGGSSGPSVTGGGSGPSTLDILALKKAKEDAEKLKSKVNITPVVEQLSPFVDVTPGTYGFSAIVRLSKNGLIEGYPQKNGTILFKPGKSVIRAEMSKMILGSICMEPSDVAKKPPQIYGDVQPGTWFFPYTKQAYIKGYFTGYKGERNAAGQEIKLFRPGNTITQAEVIKPLIEILRREGFLDLKGMKTENPWYLPYMRVAKDLERFWQDKENPPEVTSLLSEDEENPGKPMTRGEAAVFIDRMLSIYGSCRE